MAMKGYSAFSKALALLEPHHQIVKYHVQDTHLQGSYPSAEMQLVYSTAQADWADGALGSIIAIIPWFTLTCDDSICYGSIYGLSYSLNPYSYIQIICQPS